MRKMLIFGVILFVLGVFAGGITVHFWDHEELWLNRRAVGTIVLTSNSLFDIDSKILDADSASYQTLANCVVKPQQCNVKASQDTLRISINTYNSLIQPRKDAITKLNLFYKEFKDVNP